MNKQQNGLGIVESAPSFTLDGTGAQSVFAGTSVRRLTPVECLRLQGAPDDYLDLEPPLSDSAKYRLIGNAVAVPVVEWIARRLRENLD